MGCCLSKKKLKQNSETPSTATTSVNSKAILFKKQNSKGSNKKGIPFQKPEKEGNQKIEADVSIKIDKLSSHRDISKFNGNKSAISDIEMSHSPARSSMRQHSVKVKRNMSGRISSNTLAVQDPNKDNDGHKRQLSTTVTPKHSVQTNKFSTGQHLPAFKDVVGDGDSQDFDMTPKVSKVRQSGKFGRNDSKKNTTLIGSGNRHKNVQKSRTVQEFEDQEPEVEEKQAQEQIEVNIFHAPQRQDTDYSNLKDMPSFLKKTTATGLAGITGNLDISNASLRQILTKKSTRANQEKRSNNYGEHLGEIKPGNISALFNDSVIHPEDNAPITPKKQYTNMLGISRQMEEEEQNEVEIMGAPKMKPKARTFNKNILSSIMENGLYGQSKDSSSSNLYKNLNQEQSHLASMSELQESSQRSKIGMFKNEIRSFSSKNKLANVSGTLGNSSSNNWPPGCKIEKKKIENSKMISNMSVPMESNLNFTNRSSNKDLTLSKLNKKLVLAGKIDPIEKYDEPFDSEIESSLDDEINDQFCVNIEKKISMIDVEEYKMKDEDVGEQSVSESEGSRQDTQNVEVKKRNNFVTVDQ